MTTILTEHSDDLIIEAMAANNNALVEIYRKAPETETSLDGDVQWYMTDVPFPLFNGVIGTKLKDENADREIRAVLDIFDDRELPMIWSVTPLSRPLDLGQRLKAQGLQFGGDSPSMAVDLRALPSAMDEAAGIDIHLVENDSDLKLFCDVLNSIFRFPDLVNEAFFKFLKIAGHGEDTNVKNYMGLEDGKVVAVSTVIFGGGVAGIYNVGTIPEARRKGYGRAITLAPLLEARDLGYQYCVLQSTRMGFDVYTKLGFEVYCTFGRYLWTPWSSS
jgi:GNAT superfamily N-acetyltransferase